jgi:hypothetical protein
MRSAIETDESQAQPKAEAESVADADAAASTAQPAGPHAETRPDSPPEAHPSAAVAPLRERIAGWARWAADGSRLWIGLSWLGLLILLELVVLYGTDAGISYDENAQRTYGDLILLWFRSGFKDQAAMHYRDLWLYGGLFDAPLQWLVQFSPYGVYETRHFVTALVAVFGVVAAWKLAAAVAGERAGFLSALVLALTPLWVGHGLMNPKDIPFGTAAAFTSLSALRLAMGPAPIRIRDMCWAGLTTGIALGVRPGGDFVLGYPVMAAGLRLGLELLRRRKNGQPLQLVRAVINLAVCVGLVVVIGWSIMLATWPWAQLDPIMGPLHAMWVARHFGWNGTVLFEGRMVDAQELPLRYLPVWFKITLPETYLLGAIAVVVLCVGLAVRSRKLRSKLEVAGEQVLGWIMLVTFVVLPFSAVLITRPTLYDAQRHVLFLLPPMAAVIGCAMSELFAAAWLPRAVRGGFAGVFVALSILVAVDTVQLHPFEYVYFNRLSGGLLKQYRRFETDYWSIGYRDGLEYVLNQLPPQHASRRTRVVSCDGAGNERLSYYVSMWPGASDKVRVVREYEQADVLIAVRRWGCNRRPGKTLGSIKRQGAPLVYIRKVPH